jgi:hypothetical protein
MKRYRKYGTNVILIVKRFGKYRRKQWKYRKNMEENSKMIFHIISQFNLSLFHNFQSISLFNLLFFHIFHIFPIFSLFSSKIWNKCNFNSEKIWKIQKKTVKI